jgi:hypothetical protein
VKEDRGGNRVQRPSAPRSVPGDRTVAQATMLVTLSPCLHHGRKTQAYAVHQGDQTDLWKSLEPLELAANEFSEIERA